jgi:type I restriction enzyme S subunit
MLVSADVYNERIQRLQPRENDILYSREGERFGMAALVPPNVDLCLGQRMMMFRAIQDTDPGYLMWVLNSDAVYQQVIAGLAGSTSPHVNISNVVNFTIPRPPLGEQARIASHIRKGVAQVDTLTAEAERAIAILKERRAALITAAVTGKIDVRGLAPATALDTAA